MFEGFTQQQIQANGVTLNVRTKGRGPAVVLLHGYPQTHVMWAAIAPKLAETHSVVVFDTRGYGDSECPPSDADHRAFSKRTMAADAAALMTALGHEKFAVVSHDRGARVGFRLALDHADRVTRYMSLDVVPTYNMWENINMRSALGGFHWAYLAQPAPKPETMIGHDPDMWLEWLMTSWAAPGFKFDDALMAEYKRCYRKPDVIRGTCEDYRAGASCDFEDDKADADAGNKLSCPVLCLWGGSRSLGGPKTGSPLDTWRNWCSAEVTGAAVPESGHFLAEEAPETVLEWAVPFLAADL
jgi:haloacetate dehalogenase